MISVVAGTDVGEVVRPVEVAKERLGDSLNPTRRPSIQDLQQKRILMRDLL